MSAEADESFGLFATYSLADDRVLNKEAKNHEVEMCVGCSAAGHVGVLEEVRCEGEVARYGLFLALVTLQSDEIEAEQLVGVCEVVCSQEKGGIRPGPVTSVCLQYHTLVFLTVWQTSASWCQHRTQVF